VFAVPAALLGLDVVLEAASLGEELVLEPPQAVSKVSNAQRALPWRILRCIVRIPVG
jgi:hypothetical protein